MRSATDVVGADLEYIVGRLDDELTRMAGKRLLITGGAGFLGYYLIQVPLHWNRRHGAGERIRVTVHDSFIRGVPEWLRSLERVESLSVEQRDAAEPLPKDTVPFDYVIHAASIASPMHYRQHPLETMDANVNGLRAVLERARQQAQMGHRSEGLLFFSSSEVYGDPDPAHIPTPETYRGNVSCTGPRACYDESKRYGETLCVTFANVFGLPVTVARPFNNYGPGLKITDRRVIPDFARDILAGRDVVMLSDGSPTRTFCYVADAIVGYFKVLAKGRPGEAYNIGAEAPEVSMAQLAQKMVDVAADLFGYGGRVVTGVSGEDNYLTDSPSRRRPDIRKARGELGYHPQISLEEGLGRTLLWYNENRAAAEG